MNNFFPALNAEGQAINPEELAALQMNQALAQEQEQFAENMQLINEVPIEEEEGESQDVTHARKQHQQYAQPPAEQDPEQDPETMDPETMDPNEAVQINPLLSDEQLMELLQNAGSLSGEQQEQLQQLLRQRMKKDVKSQKKQQYSNIYKILTENVAKAKKRLAALNTDQPRNRAAHREDQETFERMLQQKKEYDALLRLQEHEGKSKQRLLAQQQSRHERQAQREAKLNQLRERKFEEELVNQQKSLMYKRNAQQVRLCQKVYRLASDLEKNKLLEEKREFRETQARKKEEKRSMVDNIEAFFRDKISMLKERIETERFERKIAQQAQKEALSRMKREITSKKKQELDRYLSLLKLEDAKFDMQSANLGTLESEIIKLYKK